MTEFTTKYGIGQKINYKETCITISKIQINVVDKFVEIKYYCSYFNLALKQVSNVWLEQSELDDSEVS